MVRQYYICKQLDKVDCNVSFHRFSDNKNDQKVWMYILEFGGTERALPKRVDVCSNHFDEKYLRVEPGVRKTLKKGTLSLPLPLLQPHDCADAIAEELTEVYVKNLIYL